MSDSAEHDAGTCPSCGSASCIGRLDYCDCREPDRLQAVRTEVAERVKRMARSYDGTAAADCQMFAEELLEDLESSLGQRGRRKKETNRG